MTAITSYATLQTRIGEVLHRPELTSDIPGFIELAEFRIYRELRVKQMEASLSSAISGGVVALPTGYLELKNAYVDGSPVQRLTKKDVEWIYVNYPTRSSDGKPKFIAREATNFIFGPYPDDTYTIKGVYYKKLAALSTGDNWLITDVPDLILFASLCEAAAWMQNDERIPLWESKYQAIKDRVQKQDNDEEFSGSPLAMVAR